MSGKSGMRADGTRGLATIPRVSLVAAAVVAVIGLGMVGCMRKGPGTAKNTDELLTQLKEDRTEIDQTTDTMMKRIEVFNASRKPGEQTLQFSEIFSQDLSPEQRDTLNQMMEQEKDFSYKALLQQIISDRETIKGLQENVTHLEQTLPDKFVIVKRGDKHHDLALTYLTEEAHLDPEKSKALLKEVDQTDELVAGNKVWFFYDPQTDAFRTYVTQGEAGLTPLAVRRARQRQLIKERDTFKAERDTAQTEVAGLQVTNADLEQTKTSLEDTRTRLENDIATRENSLYYHAANEKSLKDQGVLSSVLKKVRDVKGISYDESLDLREGTTITLLPENYGLAEIREVRLLPAVYQLGRDFTIETTQDHRSAKLVILDPDLFRGKEVLLAIRG